MRQGWAWSRHRRDRGEPSPCADVPGASPSPVAVVGGASPVRVAAQMWQGRAHSQCRRGHVFFRLPSSFSMLGKVTGSFACGGTPARTPSMHGSTRKWATRKRERAYARAAPKRERRCLGRHVAEDDIGQRRTHLLASVACCTRPECALRSACGARVRLRARARACSGRGSARSRRSLPPVPPVRARAGTPAPPGRGWSGSPAPPSATASGSTPAPAVESICRCGAAEPCRLCASRGVRAPMH